jgi:hypothetical protein
VVGGLANRRVRWPAAPTWAGRGPKDGAGLGHVGAQRYVVGSFALVGPRLAAGAPAATWANVGERLANPRSHSPQRVYAKEACPKLAAATVSSAGAAGAAAKIPGKPVQKSTAFAATPQRFHVVEARVRSPPAVQEAGLVPQMHQGLFLETLIFTEFLRRRVNAPGASS